MHVCCISLPLNMASATDEAVELLIDGARYGDADDVLSALERKVDVNAQDEWGKTGGRRGGRLRFAAAACRQCRRLPLAAARLPVPPVSFAPAPAPVPPAMQRCTWPVQTGTLRL